MNQPNLPKERPYTKPSYREAFSMDSVASPSLFLINWYAADRERRKSPMASQDRDRQSAIHLAWFAWYVWEYYDETKGHTEAALAHLSRLCGLSRRTLRHLAAILVRDGVIEDLSDDDPWQQPRGSNPKRYRPLPWALALQEAKDASTRP